MSVILSLKFRLIPLIKEPDEYYGMAGDKPVVACRLIEGYLPDDNDTPQATPQDFVDLDDPDAPLADGSDEEISSSPRLLPFAAGGGGAVLLAGIAYALARRKRE